MASAETKHTARPRYYVRTITSRGHVKGYGVYDNVHGMVVEHDRYLIADDASDRAGAAAAALCLANFHRDRLNGDLAKAEGRS